jgi:hypothetical protein
MQDLLHKNHLFFQNGLSFTRRFSGSGLSPRVEPLRRGSLSPMVIVITGWQGESGEGMMWVYNQSFPILFGPSDLERGSYTVFDALITESPW